MKLQRLSIMIMIILLATSFDGITVNAKAKVKLNKTKITMNVGKNATLKVKNAKKGSTITWKSKNKKIATVTKKGKVTAKKAGKTTIVATVKTGKKKTQYKCSVAVLAKKSEKDKDEDKDTLADKVYWEICDVEIQDHTVGIGKRNGNSNIVKDAEYCQEKADEYSDKLLSKLDVLFVRNMTYRIGLRDKKGELATNILSHTLTVTSAKGLVTASAEEDKNGYTSICITTLTSGTDTVKVTLDNGQVLTLNVDVRDNNQDLLMQEYAKLNAKYHVDTMTDEQEKVYAICKFMAENYIYVWMEEMNGYYNMTTAEKARAWNTVQNTIGIGKNIASWTELEYYTYSTVQMFSLGYGVCEDHAVAFEQLCQMCGIQCIYWSKQEYNHAWNYTKIKGEWYAYDLVGVTGSIYCSGTEVDYQRVKAYQDETNTMNLSSWIEKVSKPHSTITFINQRVPIFASHKELDFLDEALAYYGIQ